MNEEQDIVLEILDFIRDQYKEGLHEEANRRPI